MVSLQRLLFSHQKPWFPVAIKVVLWQTWFHYGKPVSDGKATFSQIYSGSFPCLVVTYPSDSLKSVSLSDCSLSAYFDTVLLISVPTELMTYFV